MSKNEWDWYGMEAQEDVVFPSVQAVAVYQNASKDVVIRQQGSMGEDDSIVVIPRAHVDALLEAIKQAATPAV